MHRTSHTNSPSSANIMMELPLLAERWRVTQMEDFSRLADARQQIHAAVQLPAIVGRMFSPESDEDEFASLKWLPGISAFASNLVGNTYKFRIALLPASMKLCLLSAFNQTVDDFDLPGNTFQEALGWMQQSCDRLGAEIELKAEWPYELPDNPYLEGQAFHTEDQDAFLELSHHYLNAFYAVKSLSKVFRLWAPLRVWPHHFDMATNRRIVNGDEVHYAGIGFSPGDNDNIQEPYYYLSIYPHSHIEKSDLPPLEDGMEWHSETWFGISFSSKKMLEYPAKLSQATKTLDFLVDYSNLLDRF